VSAKDAAPGGLALIEALVNTLDVETGADTLDTLAVYLGMLDVDFSVTEPAELVEHVRALAARYARATVPFVDSPPG